MGGQNKINHNSQTRSPRRPCDHLKFAKYQYTLHLSIKNAYYLQQNNKLEKNKNVDKKQDFSRFDITFNEFQRQIVEKNTFSKCLGHLL